MILNYIESAIRWLVIFITNYLPVKVIKDDKGVPFLYRYHIFKWGNNGAGVCIHHFVKSDPERGHHSHPWRHSLSFILAGGYQEQILEEDRKTYKVVNRSRWRFNYLDGVNTFHRVMIPEGGDAWTLFFFQKRSKTWAMYDLGGNYKLMNTQIEDNDGDWHEKVKKGLNVHSHVEHTGKVIATVDCIILADSKVLLIKRGKEPHKGSWAFPGGRIEQGDKDILSAAYRELKEETNLENVELKYVKTIGNNTRDSRGFCLTNIFLAKLSEIPKNIKAGDDAIDYCWFDQNDLPYMAFDHKEILQNLL